MKNILLALTLFFSIAVSSQITRAEAFEYKQLTTTQRDSYTPSVGNYPTIYNSTTQRYEFWDGDSWETLPINLNPDVENFIPLSPTVEGYIKGIDNQLGNIATTTAGVLTRIYFTGDQTILSSGTYYLSSFEGRGSVPTITQTVNNPDNTKTFFNQDVISSASLLTSTAKKGSYTSSLSVSTQSAGAGNDYSQRFTIEIYLTDINGSVIPSGVTGAPTGDLGVTVLTILDSGILELPYDAVTNITLTGNLTEDILLPVGNRIRYHISAEKIGTNGGAINQSLYLGSDRNSYYDVPTPILWGTIEGNVSNQVDLQNAFDEKANISDVYTKSQIDNFYLNTIIELENYTGEAKTIVVKDTLRGGVFNYIDSGLTSDGGVVFNSQDGGYWQRQFNKSDGLNVLWYGADPNGVSDNELIFENIIFDYGKSVGKIVIPKGDYKIENTIGDVGDFATMAIDYELKIVGDNARIFVDSASEISSVFGTEMLSGNLTLQGITFDANGKANRGIYLRQSGIIDNNPNISKSKVTIKNCVAKNAFISSSGIENSGCGIYVYGKFESINIIDNVVKNVNSNDPNVSLRGIGTGGTSIIGLYPNFVNIEKNYIENITRDVVNQTDQDGISVLYPNDILTPGQKSKANIKNNVIIDVRGRFIKLQQQNTHVSGNYMEISEGYEMPVTNTSYAVDSQFSEGIFSENEVTYKNTVGDPHLAAFNFSERTQSEGIHRMVVSNNRLVGDLSQFIRVIEASTVLKGSPYVTGNTIVGSVNYFSHFTANNSSADKRNFFFENNISDVINNNFFLNSNNVTADVTAINNINRGSVIDFSSYSDNLSLINNVGFNDNQIIENGVVEATFFGNGTGVTNVDAEKLTNYNLGTNAFTETLSDFDDNTALSGIYRVNATTTNNSIGNSGVLYHMNSGATDYITQMFHTISGTEVDRFFIRHFRPNTSTWSTLKEVIHTGNISDYTGTTSEAWISDSSLLNSMTGSIQYKRYGKMVQVRVNFNSPSQPSTLSERTIYTLPVGYRISSHSVTCLATPSGGPTGSVTDTDKAVIYIEPSGEINIINMDSTGKSYSFFTTYIMD